MACGEACDVYVCIFRIINKMVFEIVRHLGHIIIYELEVDVNLIYHPVVSHKTLRPLLRISFVTYWTFDRIFPRDY